MIPSQSPIALRISGTKERKAGFAPLVTLGVLPGNEGDNMDRITSLSEKPVYIIKHTKDYILYQIIDRKVKSFDADASGVLSIALTIASNKQLAGGQSPYTLLQRVYELFVSNYMQRCADGRDSFLDKAADNEMFRQLVANYTLEDRKTRYVEMNPQGIAGIVCVTPENAEAFFRDTQYKEFEQMKSIEVGFNCTPYPAQLTQLQIPRPVPYHVFVNGKPNGQILLQPTDWTLAKCPGTALEEYVPVEFSLQEVRAAGGHLQKNGADIMLNPIKECIECRLEQKDVLYSVDFKCSEQSKHILNKYTSAGQLKIYLGKKDITTLEGKSVPARLIKTSEVTVSPQRLDNYTFSTQAVIKEDLKLLEITVRAKEVVALAGKHNGASPEKQRSQSSNSRKIQPKFQDAKKPSSNELLVQRILFFVAGLIVGIALTFVFTQYVLTPGEKKEVKEEDKQDVNTSEEENDSFGFTEKEDSTNMDVPAAEEKPEETLSEDPTAKRDEIAEQKLKEAEERQRKEELQKKQAEQKEKNRNEILQMIISNQPAATVRKHAGYKNLSSTEKNAIEAILAPEAVAKNTNKKWNATLRKKIDEAKKKMPIKTWQDAISLNTEIRNIITNH